MIDKERIALDNTVMRCLVGSKLHGLNVAGTDDRDEMGVFIEPPENVIGLHGFEHWVFRTAGEGERSGPDDLDLTLYSLRKWVRLALGGNPTIITLMFIPEGGEGSLVDTMVANEIRHELPQWIVAKSAATAFLGYMTQQRERLEGIRAGRRKPNRPELIEKYGFDVKYAMHVCRLGYQGRELMERGAISLPMRNMEREFCFDVRTGKVEFEQVIEKAKQLEADIETLSKEGPLREKPDFDRVNQWLVETYQTYWLHKSFVKSVKT